MKATEETTATTGPAPDPPAKLWSVITASSAGTLIEWYDFYIFGSLAPIIAKNLFPADKEVQGLLSTLAIFAVGFIVRPFGSLVFGRLGDVVGRKHAFLVTLLIMGISTFCLGLVPNFAQIGWLAPLLVLILRVAQGLALGGEYGGAATYVAEHAPDNRRGYYTSFIQTTATLGLLVSIIVIVGGQIQMGKEAFEAWGWRIPFLLSAVLVVFSYLIRRRMQESPLFKALKEEGSHSTNPIKESFANKANLKLVLLALFGATMGQGVVWYTGQFYALYFLQTELKVEKVFANIVVATALILATPLFIFFGSLSDKLGRKKIMMAGCLLAVLVYLPAFGQMTHAVDVKGKALALGGREQLGDPKTTTVAEADKRLGVTPGDTVTETKFAVKFLDGTEATESQKSIVFKDASKPPKTATGYVDVKPTTATLVQVGLWVFLLVVLVTMVYGPIAAFLVELFPTKIRYSSMSLPYHIGNGVFGGLVPLIGKSMVEASGQPAQGLTYPIIVAAACFVIGSIWLPDRRGVRLSD